ncbi:acetyltransferase [Serratia rubidaea]|nr:acetyltransferase [Serratia rubidaea]
MAWQKWSGIRRSYLGIIHGVMPDLGSPAAYRRMKTGERAMPVGAVIGANAENLMPVLAQSPGPLQLLPGYAYGTGWLKIRSDTGELNKPEVDPYEEIYLNNSDWWRLCEKDLLLDDTAVAWDNYQDRINGTVKKFIEGLNGKYHPNSYGFYGASEKYPSDDHLIWRQILPPRPVFGLSVEQPFYRYSQGKTFELISSAGPGDGTVPVRSGRITFSGMRSLLAVEVDHEGAYAVGDLDTESGLSVVMKFTIRSIIKMVREVTPCG